MANLRSPEYVAVRDKFADISIAVSGSGSGSMVTLAQILLSKQIIGQHALDKVTAAVQAGQDPALVVPAILQPVHSNISFSPNTFYKFVDALRESELTVPIGDILEKHCREPFI